MMRIHSQYRTFTIGLAVLICATAQAGQKFGKDKMDVPQWALDAAKTETPAYAKEHASVILFDEYLETVDAQGRAVEREREAIRILKPQGRGDGCRVAYDVDQKINYFRAWTITANDTHFQAREGDFMEVGDTGDSVMLSTYREVVVHPPAEDIGATILCESEELMPPYFQETVWRFQGNIPAVYQAIEVDLPPGRSHAESWHRHDPIKPVEVSPNHWRWEIKDVHPLDLRDVKEHPAWLALAARGSIHWGNAAVESNEKKWLALGQKWTDLESNRPDPSPEITAQTQTLVGNIPDFFSKLQLITEYIQKNIRYFIVERGIGGWQANPAATIFRNRYGDCKDKTTLLISMLQTANIHARYLLVDSRRGVVDPDSPSFFGNHMITAIEIPAGVEDARLQAVVKAKDGKRYLIFDPTNETTAVGNLPSYLQGGYGLLAAGDSSQVMALPILKPEANVSDAKGSFTLAADGSLSGAVDSFHTGPDGGEFRAMIKYTDEKERREYWEGELGRTLPGVTLETFNFIQPSALDKPLEFHYKVTVKQFAHQAGTLLLVRPRVLGSMARPFDEKPRSLPIELGATGRWRDSFDIALPAGYVVDETPDPVALDLDFASYHSSVKAEPGHLHYEREFVLRQVELPATRAADFRKLQGMIVFDEKGAVVLKKQ
jgi:transglutaminase-like putative cysteine protease